MFKKLITQHKTKAEKKSDISQFQINKEVHKNNRNENLNLRTSKFKSKNDSNISILSRFLEISHIKKKVVKPKMNLKVQKLNLNKSAINRLKIVGQVDNKFVMLKDDDLNLIALDQHAAHERVRLEYLEAIVNNSKY